MKKIIQQVYDSISYFGIDDSLEMSKEKDFRILHNQYFSLLALIFFIHSIFGLAFVGLSSHSIFLLAISFSFLFYFVPIKNRIKKEYLTTIIFVFLVFVVTYYSSFYGFESGVFLFYFPLFSAVYIFLSWKSQKFYIIFLMLLIIGSIYFSAITDFNLIESNRDFMNFRHDLLLINITCVLLILALNSFFFQRKKEDYHFVLNRNLYKREQIEGLSTEVLRLKKLLNKDVFSEETLKELIDSMQLSDVVFIEKFAVFFPNFFDKVHQLSSKSLSVSDLKMCAMLKLGFTSKQVAIYTNSSIKSAEGKVYRLRKKLNISSDNHSKDWFAAL